MAYLSTFITADGDASPANQKHSGSLSTSIKYRFNDRSGPTSMSPTKRTRKWLEGPTPKKYDDTLEIHKVRGSKITKNKGSKNRKSFWSLPIISSLFSSDDQENNGEYADGTGGEFDLEGETIVGGNHDDANSVDDPAYDNDLTLVVDSYEEDFVVKKAQRLEDYHDRNVSSNDPRIKEWTDEEIWLFNKLNKRGQEPLLLHTWTMDFSTFPAILFTTDPKQVFINNTHGPIYNAARVLTNLIAAGPRTRDQLLCHAPTERWLFREITAYLKWSLADGKIQHKAHIPVVAIASAKSEESVESVVDRITDQLHSLSRQYRDKWRHPKCSGSDSDQNQVYSHELPTLYGFVIKYSVVAIVTCDSRVPGKPIRTLGTYDFSIAGQDVWHALAVAIVMIRARNFLMHLDKEGELGPEIVDYGSDPDA